MEKRNLKLYTLEGLKRVSRAYEVNFKKVMKASRRYRSGRHLHLLRREGALNNLCLNIQELLGTRIKEICTARFWKPCEKCTGYYIVNRIDDMRGSYRKQFIEVDGDIEGAVECLKRLV